MEANKNEPYRLRSIKGIIPERYRIWVYIAIGLVFQLSGGIYIALASQMVGSLVLLREDIMFAGYAFFVGMTMVFPILFRLKFRFTNKTLLLASALGLIVCNLFSMSVSSLPLLIAVSFCAGGLRMVGFFECMSTIQLKITPTRDFAKFFPVVYFLVLGSIQLSGITAGYISYFHTWEYMHILAVGMLSAVVLVVLFLFRHIKPPAPQPFTGIDWLGFFLWSLFLMLIIFVLEYGEHFDWLDSDYIRSAVVGAVIVFIVNIWRNETIDHPFIDIRTIKYKKVNTILFLFASMCLLLATSNILENTFTGAILHYDMLNNLSLNWAVMAGIAGGAIFSYVSLVNLGTSYKFVTGMGFLFIALYEISMYFLISPVIEKEMLYLPLFLRGAGYVVLYVVLTVYAARTIPFWPFFQALTIIGFVRTCLGTPLGTAIIGRALAAFTKREALHLGSEIDPQNPLVQGRPFNHVLEELYRQSMMVSIKEIFGLAALASILLLIMAIATRYNSLLKLKITRW